MPKDLHGTRWAIEAGADTIEHGLSLHRAPDLLETMASKRRRPGADPVDLPRPGGALRRPISPKSLVEQAKRQLDEAYRTVEAARQAGVTIAVGYDSGPPGTSAQEMLRLSEAGLSALEAITAATAGGAAALGRADLGTLDPGSIADLVVVNGEPDEDLALLARSGELRDGDEGRRDRRVRGARSNGSGCVDHRRRASSDRRRPTTSPGWGGPTSS